MPKNIHREPGNTSLGKDAIHRVSTDGLFVAFFFQIGITWAYSASRQKNWDGQDAHPTRKKRIYVMKRLGYV